MSIFLYGVGIAMILAGGFNAAKSGQRWIDVGLAALGVGTLFATHFYWR